MNEPVRVRIIIERLEPGAWRAGLFDGRAQVRGPATGGTPREAFSSLVEQIMIKAIEDEVEIPF